MIELSLVSPEFGFEARTPLMSIVSPIFPQFFR